MVQFDILSFSIQLIWLFSFLFISYIFILKSIILKLGRYIKKSSLIIKRFGSVSEIESNKNLNVEDDVYNNCIKGFICNYSI